MGFLGTNGAGKTTTLRAMLGLLRPSAGSVSILGLDPQKDRKELTPNIGYLPGELRLYESLTGTEHLALLGDLQGKESTRRNEVCERLQLSQADLRRPIREYSRGMKQKIGLVQAFQHEPKAVFLDEPTEGLDPVVQRSFSQMLSEFSNAGNAVFLSSHVMSEVQQTCSRVAVIKQGELVKVDSVDALREARSRRIKVLFGDSVNPSDLSFPEEFNASWRSNECILHVNREEVVGVLKALLVRELIDVTVEEASLDEAVIALYDGGEQ